MCHFTGDGDCGIIDIFTTGIWKSMLRSLSFHYLLILSKSVFFWMDLPLDKRKRNKIYGPRVNSRKGFICLYPLHPTLAPLYNIIITQWEEMFRQNKCLGNTSCTHASLESALMKLTHISLGLPVPQLRSSGKHAAEGGFIEVHSEWEKISLSKKHDRKESTWMVFSYSLKYSYSSMSRTLKMLHTIYSVCVGFFFTQELSDGDNVLSLVIDT